MHRPLALLGTLAMTAGVLAGMASVPLASASSHREAPAISKDPSADNTDLYAFVSPDQPDTVTIIANYIPFEEPAGGPNFFEFDPTVRYEIHIRNGPKDDDEITYQFRFRTQTRDPNTFLYNTGVINSLDDPHWNRPQFYSVTRIDSEEPGRIRELARNVRVPPVNVGVRSTPNYAALAESAITDLGEGRTVFAGQRADPFYVDVGSIFDLLGLRPFNPVHKIPLGVAPGEDNTAGFSVHSIVLRVPKSDLTHNHRTPTDPKDPNAVVGIYASASRQSTRVLDADDRDDDGHGRGDDGNGRWVQVSRLGEPLINEVLIPLGQKDRWNRVDPNNDQQFERFYLNPEPARLINSLYNEPPVVPVDTTNRTDLVTVLLTGVPGLNFTGPQKEDLLRLNMAIPVTAKPDALGVLKGDLQGFPNGRRLGDDVVDIELRAIAQGYGPVVSGLLGLPNKAPNNDLGDGVNRSDRPFLDHFPYVATPTDGYDSPHALAEDTTTEPLAP
jgi:Domain of unknown function (DUF4331)